VSTSSIWPAVIIVAVICIGLRAAGPMVLRDHDLPPRATLVIDALAPALLAGLIVVDLLGPKWHDFDWTMLPALPVAAALRWKHVPDLACLVAAIGITVALRAVS
jgi:branched-subunit amino acid transport protein